MKKVYLVDVFSFFFRAYYAIRHPMTTEAGLPTNALYGLTSMLIKLIREKDVEYIVCCYDRKEQSFRNDIYPDYKANRTEPPDDLIPQFPYVRKVTETLGMQNLDRESYEADDVIGSLSRLIAEQKAQVVIVSGDKDFAQLVNKKITIFDSMKNKVYDEAGVLEKWGVHPEQMIDYLAIVGDSSDNVPGVRGIGPKGAQKLLSEFKTLDGIYKNIEKISAAGTKNKLVDHEDMAYTSKELVTIVQDLEFDLSLEDCKLQPFDKSKLLDLFEELGFKTFTKKMLESEIEGSHSTIGAIKNKNSTSPKATVEKVKATNSPEQKDISPKDLETLIPPYSDVWVVKNKSEGLVIGYKNSCYTVTETDKLAAGNILEKKHLNWTGYNLKELWRELNFQHAPKPIWDQILGANIILSKNIKSFEDAYKAFTDEELAEDIDSQDLIAAHQKMQKILQKKLKETGLSGPLQEIELPLLPVLFSMEKIGISLDIDLLKKKNKALLTDIQKLEKKIHAAAGEEFNVASPKQLGQILFEKMKLPAQKKTKTGYSTNSEVLESLSDHEICQWVIQFRELSKLNSTYVAALPELVNPKTKRLHTHFNQAVTSTGRLSSSHPNLQNIPIRTDRGREIRKAFISTKDHLLISADYSQIELRILAHIAQDPGLIKAFEQGHDVHTATASEIFGIQLTDVTPKQRRTAKAVNFGIAYGQGAHGLAQTLQISRSESSDIIKRYFKKFAGIQSYIQEIVEEAKQQGYVETLLGRRRYIPELESSSPMIKKFGERAAINAPIQGSASEIVKKAMITIYDEISCDLLLQIHDELIFECPKEDVNEEALIIKSIMESVISLDVPLDVHIFSGANWDEAH